MISYLLKTANLLDSVGTEAAQQAAEAIDSVITVTAYNLSSMQKLYNELSDVLDHTNVGELPRGYRGRLSDLRRMQRTLNRDLAELYRRNGQNSWTGRRHLVEETPPPAAAPAESAPLPSELEDASVPHEEEAIPPLAASVIENLIKVADKLDEEGLVEAASILDSIIKEAADEFPSRTETRQDLYDAKKHNKETTIYEQTKKEVAENRKNHHIETLQGSGALHTRYSPELPGVQMQRISDGVYQDVITKKIYNFQQGWTDSQGNQHAGGSIKHQTPAHSQYAAPSRIFEGGVALRRRK